VDLKRKTKRFAFAVLKLYSALPKTTETRVTGEQGFRPGTSVGAVYREEARSRWVAEFAGKIEGGLQEHEESMHRLEVIVEGRIYPPEKMGSCRARGPGDTWS